jgi:hypothetical protein
VQNYFDEQESQLYTLDQELRSGEFSLVLETSEMIVAIGDIAAWTRVHEGDVFVPQK